MSITIQQLAVLLLVGHFGSVGFMVLVIKRQLRLMKLHIASEIISFRKTLLRISLIIMAGNIVPIIIDGLTLFINTGRPAHVKPVSIAYALSMAITELFSAYLVWVLYRSAEGPKKTPGATAALPSEDDAILEE